jgi:hypothetical protein
MIVSKKTHIRRIQHDKPINKASPQKQIEDSPTKSTTRPYSQPNQPMSSSMYANNSYNSTPIAQPKQRPETTSMYAGSSYTNGYVNGGQKMQQSVSTNNLSRQRRESTTTNSSQTSNGTLGYDVKRSTSQNNGFINAQQQYMMRNGNVKAYQNGGYNNFDSQQQRLIDAKRYFLCKRNIFVLTEKTTALMVCLIEESVHTINQTDSKRML